MDNLKIQKSVLHIIGKSSYDGTCLYAYKVFGNNTEQDFRHKVLTIYPGSANEELSISKLGCIVLLNRKQTKIFDLFIKNYRLIKLIRRLNPDIVHYHSGGISVLFAIVLLRKYSKRIIHHVHCPDIICSEKQKISFIHRFILNLLNPFTYKIFVSENVLDEYKKRICNPGKYSLICNSAGIAVKMAASKDFAVGFLGKLSKSKGYSTFIELTNKKLLTGVHFIAKGDTYDTYRDVNTASGNFTLLKPGLDINDFFSRINVLVFPTQLNEGTPFVVLEAIARNIPVITNRSLELFRDFQNYPLLIENNDAQLVADKIIDIRREKVNSEQLHQIHADLNRKYDFKTHIESITNVYRNLLK